MRTRLIALVLGGAIAVAFMPAATPTEAAKVPKTRTCHWADNDNRFVLIRIPTKQLEKEVGHARHEHDVIPAPDEGCGNLTPPAD